MPVYLALSRKLAETHPRWAVLTTVTGLLGAVTGFALEFLRLVEFDLRRRGLPTEAWDSFTASPSPQVLVVALLGPLFPATSILLGIGFLRARSLPRWVAVCLILAGVGFPLAQVAQWEWGFRLTYPLSTLLWLAALGWLGMTGKVSR